MHIFRRHVPSLSTRRILNDSNPRPLRCLHASATAQAPRKRTFFSSNAALQQEGNSSPDDIVKEPQLAQKRKPTRSPAGKTSLRRVAVEAQRSRASALRQNDTVSRGEGMNRVTALSVADQFDMDAVKRILRSHGFPIDPDQTGFESDQVIHTRGVNNGDIFVFPSGSLVAWSLPEDVALDLATKSLLPAAINPLVDQLEKEDLEYEEDPKRDNSTIKGDVILLGTNTDSQPEAYGTSCYIRNNLLTVFIALKLIQRSRRLPSLRASLARPSSRF
jgi:uncharacterized Rmd1/YagE family protein